MQPLAMHALRAGTAYGLHSSLGVTRRWCAVPVTEPPASPVFAMRTPLDRRLMTESQKVALDVVQTRENVFIGGGVGSGKTETLLQIYRMLTKSTGGSGVCLMSAGQWFNQSLGAVEMTWCSLGLPSQAHHRVFSEDPPKSIKNGLATSGFLDGVHTLILDDVEQLDYDMWVSLRKALTSLKRGSAVKSKPFGTLRVIAAGDFLATEQGENPRSHNMAFEDASWDSVFAFQVEMGGRDGNGLSFVHEESFGKMLCRIRSGEPTEEDFAALKTREIDVEDEQHGMSTCFKHHTSFPKEYEDPLAGRVLLYPEVIAYQAAGVNESHVRPRHTAMYHASTQKAFLLKGDEVQDYHVSGGLNPNAKLNVAGQSLTQAIVNHETTARALSLGEGSLSPGARSRRLIGESLSQLFAVGEEVTLGLPVEGVYAGCRGTVVQLLPETVLVKFSNGATRNIARYTVNAALQLSSIRASDVTIPLSLMQAQVSAWVSFLPLSHRKTRTAASLYASPFVNGYAPKSAVPKAVVDVQYLGETGGLRSLYAMLAHAPSLDKVEIVRGSLSSLDCSSESVAYPPAALYHRAIRDPKNVGSLPCPVCGNSLMAVCPMAATDAEVAQASPAEKLRYCVKHFRHCPVDGITMTANDYVEQHKQTSLVKCECGEIMPLRDIQGHRKQFLDGGSICRGSDNKFLSRSRYMSA